MPFPIESLSLSGHCQAMPITPPCVTAKRQGFCTTPSDSHHPSRIGSEGSP